MQLLLLVKCFRFLHNILLYVSLTCNFQWNCFQIFRVLLFLSRFLARFNNNNNNNIDNADEKKKKWYQMRRSKSETKILSIIFNRRVQKWNSRAIRLKRLSICIRYTFDCFIFVRLRSDRLNFHVIRFPEWKSLSNRLFHFVILLFCYFVAFNKIICLNPCAMRYATSSTSMPNV